MILEMLQSSVFSENEAELAEITNKIIHKIENKNDTYFSKTDYEKLLLHYLNKGDKDKLRVILSPSFIAMLARESATIKIFEQEKINLLFDVQFNLLIKSIKKCNVKFFENLIALSSHCRSKINQKLTLFEAGEMTPGATLIQLALKHGSRDIAHKLIEFGADPTTIDYYDNSILQYAAMGGEDTYAYAKTLAQISSTNIFGHTPEDYLNNKAQLELVHHNIFINKFIQYIKLNKYDENILLQNEEGNVTGKKLIEEINEGICDGESFIRAINIVRGDDSIRLYEKMSAAIRNWNGTQEELDKTLKDPDLVKEFSNLREVNLKAVFEYMMSVILVSQQYPSIAIVDIDKGDRVKMFELLRTKNDKLIKSHQSTESIASKEQFKQELAELIVPNTLINIAVGDKEVHKFGHAIFLVTDQNNNLHFIDSNTPYKICGLENNSASLDKISNLIFSYFNSVSNMTSYKYESELSLTPKPV